MAERPSDTGLTRCNILLVEDHDATARVIQRALCSWLDVRCIPATTLAEAQRLFSAAAASADPFHLVICDLCLPDGSGLQLPRLLGAGGAVSAAAGRVQLIAASAMASLNDEAVSLAAGFDAHLRKPFRLDELTGTVRALLERSACTEDVASA